MLEIPHCANVSLESNQSTCCNILDAVSVMHVTRRAAEVGQLNVHVKHQRRAGVMLIGAPCDTHYSS